MKLPISDALRNALRKSPEGVKIEVDGEPSEPHHYFLLSGTLYQQAMEALREQHEWEDIKRGLQQAHDGETISLTDAWERLRRECNLPDRT